MKILGICNANNSGAAIIVDDVVLASVNEERFTRNKLTKDFPSNSIKYVLDVAGLSLDDIDFIGCGAWAGIDSSQTLPVLLGDLAEKTKCGEYSEARAFDRLKATMKSDALAKQQLIDGCINNGIPIEKLNFCDHHLSHALVAFYPSDFEEAVVLVADGRGDFRSVSLWHGSRKDGLKHLHTTSELNSLGAMYGFITKLLGYTPDRHEGKVTGLSARGKPGKASKALSEAVSFNQERGEISTIYGDSYLPYMGASLPFLEKLLADSSKEDLAYAAQTVLEQVLRDYLEFYLKKYYPAKNVNLCLSGGCAANVKLNYELSNINQVKRLYVSPEMGDGGNALGGAIDCCVKYSKHTKIQMPNVYLGPKFTGDQVIDACEKFGLQPRSMTRDEKIKIGAKYINEGKIIGWFQGRMEYGPRALGARSILASSRDNSINDSLNRRLNRTEFMPFAPVTTDKLAPLCFIGWEANHIASRFMTTCYQCTDLLQVRCPATVHVDNTARPQVVRYEDNRDYHDLIEEYYRISGNPALINTSFNHHEEPIVCSPEDAMRSFLKGNVDCLIIEDVLIVNHR